MNPREHVLLYKSNIFRRSVEHESANRPVLGSGPTGYDVRIDLLVRLFSRKLAMGGPTTNAKAIHINMRAICMIGEYTIVDSDGCAGE